MRSKSPRFCLKVLKPNDQPLQQAHFQPTSILFQVSTSRLSHSTVHMIEHIGFQNPNVQVGGSQVQPGTGFQSQNFANQQPSWQSMILFSKISHRVDFVL